MDSDRSPLTVEQQRDALIRSLDTRGWALRVSFIVNGLLVIALLVGAQIAATLRGDLAGARDDLKTGRESRQDFQAEQRYMFCRLVEDDVRSLSSDTVREIAALCDP